MYLKIVKQKLHRLTPIIIGVTIGLLLSYIIDKNYFYFLPFSDLPGYTFKKDGFTYQVIVINSERKYIIDHRKEKEDVNR